MEKEGTIIEEGGRRDGKGRRINGERNEKA